MLANQRRGDRRRTALADRLGAELSIKRPDHAGALDTGVEGRAALARLDTDDRELLLLTAAEGFAPARRWPSSWTSLRSPCARACTARDAGWSASCGLANVPWWPDMQGGRTLVRPGPEGRAMTDHELDAAVAAATISDARVAALDLHGADL